MAVETESGPTSAVTAASQTAGTSQEEDDSELKDLVTQTLQSAGILGKIKAELRSSVYLALENGSSRESKESRLRKSRGPAEKLSGFLENTEGRLALHLVKEFLTFFDLTFTLSVLEPESDAGLSRASSHRSRQELVELLGLAPEMVDNKTPLISQIIRLSKVSVLKSETPSPTEFIEDSHRTDVDSYLNPSSLHPAPQGAANTPTLQSLTTPESSLNAAAFNSASLERVSSTKQPEPQAPSKSTFLHNEPTSSIQEVKKSSFLGDLPPLGSGNAQTKGGSLPPLKKTASKDSSVSSLEMLDGILGKDPPSRETKDKVTTESSDIPRTNKPRPIPDEDEEIAEEINEFSEDFSISATSEGFTKDESLRNEAHFKADYIEHLDK